ncbi:MAG: dihydropyrimidinase [Anaerolineae bacterium]|nr:dihydropyrimidinase [Anaerolineae bacterium]
MKTLIKSGTIVTASDTLKADILIEDEKIALMGTDLPADGAQVVDAQGKLVMPGGIDVHVHFDMPFFATFSSDDHYTGSKAAAFGGTTTYLDFVPLEGDSPRASVEAWGKKAEKSVIDYGFHIMLSRWNPAVEAEIPGLVKDGVTSLKVFTAYESLRISDAAIFQVMRSAKKHGLLTMLHAEGGEVIDVLIAEALAAGHTTPEYHALTHPAWGAVGATMKACSLAAQAETPLYIVHMNAAGEMDMLKYAREHGVPVMGETCPQYLFFGIDDLRRPDGAKWVCSPPVRSPEDNARVWEALCDGTLQVLSTDHCPFMYDGTTPIMYEGKPYAYPGKELGKDNFSKIPNGLPGVGDRLPVFWSEAVSKGRISPNQFVALTATNPAKIFGLYPRKGTLAPGSDADIAIWDANKRVTYGVKVAQHRTDYNLYEGWQLVGFPEKVFSRGRLIVDNGEWHGRPGMGQYIHRNPNPPLL